MLFLDYQINDSNRETLYNYIEMNLPKERWDDFGGDPDQELHEQEKEVIVSMVGDSEELEKIRYSLHYAVENGYESGARKAAGNAIDIAFRYNMQGNGVTLFFEQGGRYTPNFDLSMMDNNIILGLDFDAAIEIMKDPDEIQHLWYEGWYEASSGEFMLSGYEDEMDQLDEDAANETLYEYLDV